MISVAGPSAIITRAEDEYGILSGTAVEFVVVGTLRRARLGGCYTLAVGVNGSSWADFGRGRLKRGLYVKVDAGDIRTSTIITFDDRWSEDEARKDGEWEQDEETHVVGRENVVCGCNFE
jgi:hypothetical protein